MSDGWATIAQMLGLREQRKRDTRDRISSNVGNIASMLYGSREREAGQEFAAGEGALNRASTADLTEAQLENTRVLQGIAGTQALEQIGAGGEQARETQAAGAEQAAALEQLNIDARKDLQGQMDEGAMARLDAQIGAEQDMMTREWEQQSAQYETEQTYFSAATGKIYKWQTEEEFKMAQGQMEQDNYIEALRLQATLNDDTPDVQSRIIEAYTFAKNEVLNPSVLNPQTGQWQSMADITPEALEQQFRDAIALHSLSPEEVEKAVVLFRGFIAQIQDGEAGADTAVTPTRLERYGLSPELAATPGIAGLALNKPLTTEGEAPGERVYTTPQAVDQYEAPFYDQLKSLIGNPEVGEEAKALQTRIETQTVDPNELRDLLDEILARLSPTGSRRFNYTPIRPQSSAPQGDGMAFVSNMLSRMG